MSGRRIAKVRRTRDPTQASYVLRLKEGQEAVVELQRVIGGVRQRGSAHRVVGAKDQVAEFQSQEGKHFVYGVRREGPWEPAGRLFAQRLSDLIVNIKQEAHAAYPLKEGYNADCHWPVWNTPFANVPAAFFFFGAGGAAPAMRGEMWDAFAEAAAWFKAYPSPDRIANREERLCVMLEALTLLPNAMCYRKDRNAFGQPADIATLPRNYGSLDCEDGAKEVIYLSQQLESSLKAGTAGKYAEQWEEALDEFELAVAVGSASQGKDYTNHVFPVAVSKSGDRVAALESTGWVMEAFDTGAEEQKARKAGELAPAGDGDGYYDFVTALVTKRGDYSLVTDERGVVGVKAKDFFEGKYETKVVWQSDEKDFEAARGVIEREQPAAVLDAVEFRREVGYRLATEIEAGRGWVRITKTAKGAAVLAIKIGGQELRLYAERFFA